MYTTICHNNYWLIIQSHNHQHQHVYMDLSHYTIVFPHFTLAASSVLHSSLWCPEWRLQKNKKLNNSDPNHNDSLRPLYNPNPCPHFIPLLLYYHISGIQWSANDRNIMFRDYFWNTMSSNKSHLCQLFFRCSWMLVLKSKSIHVSLVSVILIYTFQLMVTTRL